MIPLPFQVIMTWWLALFALLPLISADLFTSVADMQGLLDSERAIPDLLMKYIANEEARLTKLKE